MALTNTGVADAIKCASTMNSTLKEHLSRDFVALIAWEKWFGSWEPSEMAEVPMKESVVEPEG